MIMMATRSNAEKQTRCPNHYFEDAGLSCRSASVSCRGAKMRSGRD